MAGNAMLAMNKSWTGGLLARMYALDYLLDQLVRIAPYLESQPAAHLWRAGQAGLTDYNTWPVAALLYPHLPPDMAVALKTWLTETVIPAAAVAVADPPRYAFISTIALAKPMLPASDWAAAFKQAEAVASQLDSPVFRSRAWLKLTPHFAGQAQYLALRQALNELETIPDISYRQQELFRLLPQLAAQPGPQDPFACVRLLRLAAALNRPELLKVLRLLGPVLRRLGAGQPVAQAVEQIALYFA